MKRIFTFVLLAAFLGGCAVVPLGYGYQGDGYARGQGYHQGDGHHRGNDYDHGDDPWRSGYHDHGR